MEREGEERGEETDTSTIQRDPWSDVEDVLWVMAGRVDYEGNQCDVRRIE